MERERGLFCLLSIQFNNEFKSVLFCKGVFFDA